jgi:O-antigen/teichoic acid export membrane protein
MNSTDSTGSGAIALMHNIKEKTIRGGFARACAQAADFLLRIGSLMILSRLLEPKDFGLVGMVTAVIGVFNLFRDFGLSTASIQRKSISDEQLSTLFWINMLVGTILGLMALAAAPFIVSFYHEPRLLGVTAVLAAGFILNAAGVQHSALLQRQMRFISLAVIGVLSSLVSTVVGIVLAKAGFGYWALVWMGIASPAVTTLCLWLATSWVPGLPRRNVELRSMMRFGGTVTLNGLVVYVAYNLEKVLLGRFWGADVLGVYGRAYQLVNIPTDNLNATVGGVAFPVLSRLQDDAASLRRYFLKAYSLVLAITVPITVACCLFGQDIIVVLLGPKWTQAAPIFRLLAPTMFALALINPFSWLLFALGLVGRSLKIALVIAPLTIAGYAIGLPYGPKGVAIGYSAAMTLWIVPHIFWCIKGTVISGRDILKVLRPPLLSILVAGPLAFASQFLYHYLLPSLPRLVLECGILMAAYFGMLCYAMGQKAFYLDLIRNLRGGSPAEERTLVSVSGSL